MSVRRKVENNATDLIRELLEEEKLNQQQLADRMGVMRQSVSQMLNRGKGNIRLDNFEKMLRVLGYELEVVKKQK